MSDVPEPADSAGAPHPDADDIRQQSSEGGQFRYDPMTGEPIGSPAPEQQFNFDPITGERLRTAPATTPRRGLSPALILGAVGAIVLLIGVGAALVALRGPSQLEKDQAACQSAIGDYVTALNTVDSRLDVGLNIGAYTEVVGQAAVESDKVDEDAAVLDKVKFCSSAYDGANAAMMSYSVIASSWNDCIFDSSCDPDSDLDLQGLWADNSETLAAVKKAIDTGEPIDPSSDVGQRIKLMTDLGDLLNS